MIRLKALWHRDFFCGWSEIKEIFRRWLKIVKIDGNSSGFFGEWWANLKVN
jgi:hypothetical protein